VALGATEIILQELLQGVPTEDEFDRLYAYLRTQRFFGPTKGLESHAEAARIYFRCRRKGISVRSTIDCLIAQVAIENDLLHNDRDYPQISRAIPELQLFETR
jgi:predicted nucleic acid-binding protein